MVSSSFNITASGEMFVNSSVASDNEGCIVMDLTGPLPWDNQEDVISFQVRNFTVNVMTMIILPFFFVLGAPTNLLSMIVFYKQGLRQGTNVCLFSLSLVDLLYEITSFCLYVERFWSNSLDQPPYLGPVIQFIMNKHLLGLYGLGWASLFISAVIAVERCLCVVFPLRFQSLVETKTIWGIIVVGVVIITAGRFGVTEKYRIVCLTDERTRHKQMVNFASDYYLNNKHIVDTLDVVVYGLLIPVVAIVTVTIATSITALTLRKAVAWRRGSSTSVASSMPVKEIHLTKMLIYLSVQFIVLNIPNILFRLVSFFVQDLSISGRYYNLYFLLLGTVEVTASMNTSLNFLIYVFTGSRYRETMLHLIKKSAKTNEMVMSVKTTHTSHEIM